jgi:hypothetical protein
MLSSKSRRTSPSVETTDVLLLGDSWPLPVFASALHRQRITFRALQFPSPPHFAAFPIHIGNGEIVENAYRIFGESLASDVWQLSQSSFERVAQDFPATLTPTELVWFGRTPRETTIIENSAERIAGSLVDKSRLVHGSETFAIGLVEPAYLFDARHLPWAGLEECRSITSLSPRHNMAYTLQYVDRTGTSQSLKASMVVLVSEAIAASLFSGLRDKFIPVTLSAFRFAPTQRLPAGYSLFQLGADFAVEFGDSIRLGSFRNLFEDRAAGVLERTDLVTEKNVRRFFSGLEWVAPASPATGELSVEALSCDGLPVVGELAEAPGVYVAGGFGGRAGNFIFAVADRLSAGLSTGNYTGLDRISTKRFL